jgi:hypothetical protein
MPAFLTFKTFLKNLVPWFPMFSDSDYEGMLLVKKMHLVKPPKCIMMKVYIFFKIVSDISKAL